MERIKLAPTAKAEVDSIVAKLNIKQSALCQIVAPGKNVNYLSNCLYDGVMPQEVIDMLVTLGADRDKLVTVAKADPVTEPDSDMRKAVMNGIIDAWLIIQKQEEQRRHADVKALVLECLEDEEIFDKFQYLMYQSINGAMVKLKRDGGMHDGLVPQKW